MGGAAIAPVAATAKSISVRPQYRNLVYALPSCSESNPEQAPLADPIRVLPHKMPENASASHCWWMREPATTSCRGRLALLQLVWIWMRRGKLLACFGIEISSTPFLHSALMASASAVSGSEKRR